MPWSLNVWTSLILPHWIRIWKSFVTRNILFFYLVPYLSLCMGNNARVLFAIQGPASSTGERQRWGGGTRQWVHHIRVVAYRNTTASVKDWASWRADVRQKQFTVLPVSAQHLLAVCTLVPHLSARVALMEFVLRGGNALRTCCMWISCNA